MECSPASQVQEYYKSALLKNTLPAVHQGSPELQHRLSVARQVFDKWTRGGSQEADLADRHFDGCIAALEQFVQHSPQNVLHTAPSLTYSLPSSDQAPLKAVQLLPVPVDRRHVDELCYDEFVLKYLLPNQPVIIQGTNDEWQASREWAKSDSSVNITFMEQNFGDAKIWATETNRQSDGQYGAGKRHEMTFREFAAYWRQRAAGLTDKLLYLKDWHFVSEFCSYKAYTCPFYFCEDWLNDFYDLRQASAKDTSTAPSQQEIITSDYRFVYLGPKGSWTPLHADVLRSYSWSTNVVGRKRWQLLSPEHTPLLFDRFGREMASCFDLAERDPDAAKRFPNLAEAAKLVIQVEQGTNEAIFVPSGWHHTVENLQDTLSINHNWINGFNIHWGWDHLQQEYANAARAIEDCRELVSAAEFEDLVQRNMAANCGLNYLSMAQFMGTIAVRQQERLLKQPSAAQADALADAFSLQKCLLLLQGLLSAMASTDEMLAEQVSKNTKPCNAYSREGVAMSLLALQQTQNKQEAAVALSVICQTSTSILNKVRKLVMQDNT